MTNTLTNLPNILKDTGQVYEQISLNLRKSKVSLDKIKKAQLTERETLRRLHADKLRLERNVCSVEALILNLQNEVIGLEKKNQELVCKIGHLTWNQTKADLIANSEKKTYERKEASIEKYISMNTIQEVNPINKGHNNDDEESSRMTYETHKLLENELNEINIKITKTSSEVLNVEQENRVSQKRNSALLLRLQRLLKETDNRRNQVAALLERMKQEKTSHQL